MNFAILSTAQKAKADYRPKPQSGRFILLLVYHSQDRWREQKWEEDEDPKKDYHKLQSHSE